MLIELLGFPLGILLAKSAYELSVSRIKAKMSSRYRIQIVDTLTNEVCEFEPGLQVEKDLIASCVEKITANKVGLFRSTKRVEAAVRKGIQETIFELKAQVRPHYHVN